MKAPQLSMLSSSDMSLISLPSPRALQFSAWHGHVAFAYWLVQNLAPHKIVELGTHNGVSYFAMCKAVQTSGIECQCYAVDTWQGDDHAGAYGGDVLDSVRRFNLEYDGISTLIQSTFDEALSTFANGSIDLLHIDGLHTYEAVSHDFHSWLPKLSDKAVVVFHDTNVYHENFGVYLLWQELEKTYPAFQFLHSAGLGMIVVGNKAPLILRDLCRMESDQQTYVRANFQYLSEIAFNEGKRVAQEAISQSKGINLAQDCPAFQSSFCFTKSETAQGAVNGQITGRYGFHTAVEDTPWWYVDLLEEHIIDQVLVFNRIDEPCKERSSTLRISASVDAIDWKIIYDHHGPAFGGADGDPLSVVFTDLKARYVRLSLRSRNYLHLDEVEIRSFV